MAATVSLRKGAEELGIALSTLQHHVKRGNVNLIDGKVDVDLARIQLAKNVHQEQSMRGRQNAAPASDEGESSAPPSDSPLWKAKEATERQRAALLAMEVAERRGELIKRADVEAALSSKLVGTRDALMSMADRLAAVVAVETDVGRIRDLMSEEIRSAMRVLAAEAPTSSS